MSTAPTSSSVGPRTASTMAANLRRDAVAGPRPPAPAPAAEPVVITGAALGLPGRRAGLRRRQHRPHPRRPAVHRHDPAPAAPARCSTSTSPGWSSASPATPRSRRSTTKPRSSSWPAAAHLSISSGVRRRRRPRRGAGRDDPAGHRRRLRRAARRRHPAGAALQDHDTGHQAARPVGAARAMRDDTGVIFASAFPGLTTSPTTSSATTSTAATANSCARWRRCARGCATTSRPRRRSTGASHELRHTPRDRAVRLRPALPVPVPVDGPLAVRRDHRRARAEHADQRGVREHHAGRRAGRGLDPRRPLPPGRRRRRRRRDLRRAAAVARGEARAAASSCRRVS